MSSSKIKVRAKRKKDIVTLKALLSHPMETGLRKNSKGETIPAHFIKEVTLEVNGNPMSYVEMSTAVSKNPYIQLHFSGNKGDEYKLSFVDNVGATAEHTGTIR